MTSHKHVIAATARRLDGVEGHAIAATTPRGRYTVTSTIRPGAHEGPSPHRNRKAPTDRN